MRGLKLLGWCACAATLVWPAAHARGDTVRQSFNVGNPVSDSTWTPAEVGWTIHASGNYQLTGVDTLFNDFNTTGGDGRAVTLEVYDAAPSGGGALQRSATFVPQQGSLGGVEGLLGSATFSPLPLASGQDYFIGFRNVASLGLNFATSGTSAGRFSYGYTDGGKYSLTVPSGYVAETAILQLRGVDLAVVPLPTAGIGGLALLGGLILVRCRRRFTAAS